VLFIKKKKRGGGLIWEIARMNSAAMGKNTVLDYVLVREKM
jgi:hypothetical protein